MMPDLEHLELSVLLASHSHMQFTGRVEIVDKLNGHHLGLLHLDAGILVSARYRHKSGLKAFNQLYLDHWRLVPMIFQDAPEEIDFKQQLLHLDIKEQKEFLEVAFKHHLKWQKFHPSQSLKLVLKAEALTQTIDMLKMEYDLMGTMADWNKVEDIYLNSPLDEYETTIALVGLRQKGFIKVVAQEDFDS
jgi:hypothetical protein